MGPLKRPALLGGGFLQVERKFARVVDRDCDRRRSVPLPDGVDVAFLVLANLAGGGTEPPSQARPPSTERPGRFPRRRRIASGWRRRLSRPVRSPPQRHRVAAGVRAGRRSKPGHASAEVAAVGEVEDLTRLLEVAGDDGSPRPGLRTYGVAVGLEQRRQPGQETSRRPAPVVRRSGAPCGSRLEMRGRRCRPPRTPRPARFRRIRTVRPDSRRRRVVIGAIAENGGRSGCTPRRYATRDELASTQTPSEALATSVSSGWMPGQVPDLSDGMRGRRPPRRSARALR